MSPAVPPEPSQAERDAFTEALDRLRPEPREPRLREAARLLEGQNFLPAMRLLQEFLKASPNDTRALHLMAEANSRQGRHTDAERLLRRVLELNPDFAAARLSYAHALLETGKPEASLKECRSVLESDPHNPLFRRALAMALEAFGDFPAAAVIWQALTCEYPERADCWLRYGHSLRGSGRSADAVAAYRSALALDPSYTRAYWGLENLKTFRFDDSDVRAMEAQFGNAALSQEDRTQLHFALGRAYGDRKLHAKSFEHYAKGNAIHRLRLSHDPDVLTAYVARCKRLFTAEFFEARNGAGASSAAPIFLVGMTRSGSTLVEQILASHSSIEGTLELTELSALARSIEEEIAPRLEVPFPEVLDRLDRDQIAALGERYLESTRRYRKLGRPFFTDKMGANLVYVGMLQLILPNARIVDVRRHPLACCWSNFTQLFAKGQQYAYRLTDLARLYRDYVELMAHFDRELPGKVHRILYEQLVENPEAEVRRLLEYLGLPFEKECLEFHRTARPLSTASSEQVRRPIFKDGLEQWRNYEPWLGPLKTSLGSVLDTYPDVPAFD
ncbi:MAG TPA: sulfotransferase [Rhizomicrobium sp.]